MAYGLFRLAHEFLRETPRMFGPLSGYQIASLAVFGLGLGGFAKRWKRRSAAATTAPSEGVGCLNPQSPAETFRIEEEEAT
jgi:prolipoprotein diacylglyceryltransferase